MVTRQSHAPTPTPVSVRPSAGVFGDPWSEPPSAASKAARTLALVAAVAAAIVFSATASAWIDGFSSEPPVRLAAASLPEPGGGAALDAATLAKMATSPIPVLVPNTLSATQASEIARRFRAVPDGYFVRISYERYDVVLNGARAARAADAPQVQISESETGLSASFARDGGEYLIEFS
jgi:hypothetical protein